MFGDEGIAVAPPNEFEGATRRDFQEARRKWRECEDKKHLKKVFGYTALGLAVLELIWFSVAPERPSGLQELEDGEGQKELEDGEGQFESTGLSVDVRDGYIGVKLSIRF